MLPVSLKEQWDLGFLLSCQKTSYDCDVLMLTYNCLIFVHFKLHRWGLPSPPHHLPSDIFLLDLSPLCLLGGTQQAFSGHCDLLWPSAIKTSCYSENEKLIYVLLNSHLLKTKTYFLAFLTKRNYSLLRLIGSCYIDPYELGLCRPVWNVRLLCLQLCVHPAKLQGVDGGVENYVLHPVHKFGLLHLFYWWQWNLQLKWTKPFI